MLFSKSRNATKRKHSPLLLSVSSAFVLILSIFAPVADAANFDQQINQLTQTNLKTIEKQEDLGGEAESLGETIAALQAEIASLDKQIAGTQSKVSSLEREIAQAEAELDRQRKLLGINIREMYMNSDMTTLEMLASSKDFSHFVDQEQYRSSLNGRIDETAKRVKKLGENLNDEKKKLEDLMSDQESMKKHAEERRSVSQQLLGLNKEQQRVYQNQIRANAAKIAELREQQAEENKKGEISQPTEANVVTEVVAEQAQANEPAVPQAPHGSEYPWANVPFPNRTPDPWGMFMRQCVSYTAWKVAASGRHMPYWGGRGNAKLWDENAIRAGIPVDTNPRVGDVAISNAGTYGHAMYVEAVHGDGTITVSQYNAGWDGKYSEVRRSTAGLVFIHF